MPAEKRCSLLLRLLLLALAACLFGTAGALDDESALIQTSAAALDPAPAAGNPLGLLQELFRSTGPTDVALLATAFSKLFNQIDASPAANTTATAEGQVAKEARQGASQETQKSSLTQAMEAEPSPTTRPQRWQGMSLYRWTQAGTDFQRRLKASLFSTPVFTMAIDLECDPAGSSAASKECQWLKAEQLSCDALPKALRILSVPEAELRRAPGSYGSAEVSYHRAVLEAAARQQRSSSGSREPALLLERLGDGEGSSGSSASLLRLVDEICDGLETGSFQCKPRALGSLACQGVLEAAVSHVEASALATVMLGVIGVGLGGGAQAAVESAPPA